MDERTSPLLDALRARFVSGVLDSHCRLGDATASVEAARIAEVALFLRDDPALRFEMLSDLTCVDYLGQQPRFELVYHFYSVAKNHRLRIKARVPESDPRIASLAPIYPSADWMEREVWDLYGVKFDGHPDLRRLLLYEEFEGHPLRKDYPKERRQPLVGPRN